MSRTPNGIIVVTGSDTAVGKTVVSSLLCQLALRMDKQVVGLKPFSTGDRNDATRLVEAVNGNASEPGVLDTINPWHFSRPVAPCIAAAGQGTLPRLDELCHWIESHAGRNQLTVVEGAGGLLSPLGEDYTVLDVACRLGAQIVCVVNNKIGAINQARLCYEALSSHGVRDLVLILNQAGAVDESSASNELAVAQRCPGARIATLEVVWGLQHPACLGGAKSFFEKMLAAFNASDKSIRVLCEAISRSAKQVCRK